MDAIRAVKSTLLLGLLVFSLKPVNAAELISLDPSEEIKLSVRLESFLNLKQPSLEKYVLTSVNPLDELKKKLLTRDLGPLELNLNIVNPTRMRANSLAFNLDLIESYDLLRPDGQARSQLLNDIRAIRDDGLLLIRAPFEGLAGTLGLIKAEII